METSGLPTLIWVTDPISECLDTGKPIVFEDVVLNIVGTRIITYELEMGHCAKSGIWYGLLTDLLDILFEEKMTVEDIDGFVLDYEPHEAGIFFVDSETLVRWGEITGQMEVNEKVQEPPTSDEMVRSAVELPEDWEVGIRATVWIRGKESGKPVPGYTTIVVSDSDFIRYFDVKEGQPPTVTEIKECVLRSVYSKMERTKEGRPRRVIVSDSDLQHALADQLAEAGIPVVFDLTTRVDMAFQTIEETTGDTLAEGVFTRVSEAEVKAFFQATSAFYKVKPWQYIRGDHSVAFQLPGEKWRYLNVMGQQQEEYGLAIFDSWMHVCMIFHNRFEVSSGNVETGRVTSEIEGVSLFPETSIYPEEILYLSKRGIKPLRGNVYPVPLRMTPSGFAKSELPLSIYTTVLEAVANVVQNLRGSKIRKIDRTIVTKFGEVVLRYPARGQEEISSDRTYRLVISGKETVRNLIPAGERIEIHASGKENLSEVARGIRKVSSKNFVLIGFRAGESHLWNNLDSFYAPSPCVAHLDGLGEISLGLDNDMYPCSVTPTDIMEPVSLEVNYVKEGEKMI